jgi:hypothetical protein
MLTHYVINCERKHFNLNLKLSFLVSQLQALVPSGLDDFFSNPIDTEVVSGMNKNVSGDIPIMVYIPTLT